MAKFKIVISNPEIGSSRVVEIEDSHAVPLIGRRIGEIVDGSVVGLSGFKIQITGGTDKSGFPMRPDVHGGVKRSILTSGGVGYKPKEKGIKKRKTVRGNTITEDIMQINMKIIEKSKKKQTQKKQDDKSI
jgi:small subunit ribosomal protein S6e